MSLDDFIAQDLGTLAVKGSVIPDFADSELETVEGDISFYVHAESVDAITRLSNALKAVTARWQEENAARDYSADISIQDW